jgi:outer membrane receptor protein involved in Fe transport
MESTSPGDSYTGQNNLLAGYVSFAVPVTDKFKAVGGARYETNIQSIQSHNLNGDPMGQDKQTGFLLPSINLSYNFTEKSLLRAAYGKTLNRPEFREIAPYYFYDNTDNAGIYGSLYQSLYNPNGKYLSVAQVNNFDIRYELYPSDGEMLQVGGFYKSFSDPIQKVLIPGGDQNDFTFVNCESSTLYGIEVEIRKNLGFADRYLNSNFLKYLTFVGNATLSKSEIVFGDSTFNGVYTKVPNASLQGQSPYVINAGLYFQDEKGFSASVLYNVYGPRVYSFGVGDVAHLYELPFKTLDLNFEKTFCKHYSLSLGVQNLLDTRARSAYDLDGDNTVKAWESNNEWKGYNMGRYYTMGLKVKF